MGVRAHASAPAPRPRPRGPGTAAALVVFLLALVPLLANGRPVGEARGGGAAGWLWSGAVALAAPLVEMDDTARALVGKGLAAVFAALAAALLYAAVARRHPLSDARWAGITLALGTTLAAAAQAWSPEAAATCAVAAALLFLVRGEAEDDGRVAARAGLPLGLAVALQPSTVALAVVLAAACAWRFRREWPSLVTWAAPGVAVAAGALAFAGPPARAGVPDPGPLALLVSPAKGALVFVPVALASLVGLARALRASRVRRLWDQPTPGRFVPASCAIAFVAHLGAVLVFGGWSEGGFWGPRLLAPAWPLLLAFLPEGLAALSALGGVLVLVSIAVQAIGVLTYDGRWDRLQREANGAIPEAAAWSVRESPLALALGERVLRPALVRVEGRRLVVRERTLARSGAAGSFVSFASGAPRPTGADATLHAVRLEQGARVTGGRLALRAPGDALGFSVREGARARRLEVRVAGRGDGTLGLGASSPAGTRWTEKPVSGTFRLRFPYAFADTGATDLAVALRRGGPVVVDSVALVPPSEPENVLRLP